MAVARLHQHESGASVDYRQATAEELAGSEAGEYDVVTCLEMLEHVPDPSQVIKSCAELVKPGGHVFFSTINRNPKSFLFAIVGAEYVLKLLPSGTHEYAKFIRPSELEAWARSAGLRAHGKHRHALQPRHQGLFARTKPGRQLPDVFSAARATDANPGQRFRSRAFRSRRHARRHRARHGCDTAGNAGRPRLRSGRLRPCALNCVQWRDGPAAYRLPRSRRGQAREPGRRIH